MAAKRKSPTKRLGRKTAVPYGATVPAGKFSLARQAKATKLSPPNVSLEVLGGDVAFTYTTPSVREKRTKKELLALGCRFVRVEKKAIDKKAKPRKDGSRPLKITTREELAPGSPDYCYTQTSAPCSTSRKSCPVQLVFDHGQPALRFCFAKNQRGFAHRFSSVDEAARFAEEACKCWSKTGSFEKCREYFSEGLIGVGGAKKRKKAPKRRDAIVVAAQRRKAGAHTDKRKRRGKQKRAWRDEEY